MNWDAIVYVPLSKRYPEHFSPDPDNVKVIVAEHLRMARTWLHDHGFKSLGDHGAPHVVIDRSGVDRMRGREFSLDDELLVLGIPSLSLLEEAKAMFAARQRLPRRPATRIIPGESEAITYR